jgi:hypothetical protein
MFTVYFVSLRIFQLRAALSVSLGIFGEGSKLWFLAAGWAVFTLLFAMSAGV